MLEAFLNANRIPYRAKGKNVGQGNVAISCLWHDDVSAHLNIDSGRMFYRCWVCGETGNRFMLKKKLLELGYDCSLLPFAESTKSLPKKKLDVNFIRIIPDSSLLWDWVAEKPNDLKDIYRDRWVIKEKVKMLDVFDGINTWGGYFIFKVDEYYVGRLYNNSINGEKWKKYGTMTKLFMEDYCIGHDGIGYITEGIFDCLRFPIGEAVALLGNMANMDGIMRIHNCFKDTKKICLALDNDVLRKNIDFIKNNLEALGHVVTEFKLDKRYKDIDEYCIINNVQEYGEILEF